jgi:hypothetical protein
MFDHEGAVWGYTSTPPPVFTAFLQKPEANFKVPFFMQSRNRVWKGWSDSDTMPTSVKNEFNKK